MARTLAALPTRDALLPILANLFAAAEQGLSLAALWDRLPARFGRAGLLDNFPVAASRAILAQLIPAGTVVEVEFDHSDGVVDCSRVDGSRTPLNGSAVEDWQHSQATLTHFFTPALGFDAIAQNQRARRRAGLFPQRRYRPHPALGQRAAAAHLCGQRFAIARRSHRRASARRARRDLAPARTRVYINGGAPRERISEIGPILDSNPSVSRV